MKTQLSSTKLDVFKDFEIVNTMPIKGGDGDDDGSGVTGTIDIIDG